MNLLQSKKFKSYIEIKHSQVSWKSVQGAYNLYLNKATVPFVARYRKDQTAGLDEVGVRTVFQSFEDFEVLEKRRAFVLEEIKKQGNLTQSLEKQISICWELREIEELYKPYKTKKKTKASFARDAGLQPLADWIWDLAQGKIQSDVSLEVKAKEFINVQKSFVTYQEVIRGAQCIVTERIYTDVDIRKEVKDEFSKNGEIRCQKTTKFKANSKFSMYADYKDLCKNLLQKRSSHRYLAIRRGWQEKELKVSIEVNKEELLKTFEKFIVKVSNPIINEVALQSAKVALETHVLPSVSNEWHVLLKEAADAHAAEVFSNNIAKILLAAPFGSKVVIGIDPGLKTGCKIALIDGDGGFISHTVMHILKGDDLEKAKKLFSEVLAQVKIEGIAIGNGTGGREAEKFVREVLKSIGKEASVPVVVVNESGASVYSASDIAREEFPNLDLTVRGAISIARRLQDPLAELVKIDPKSIGVGQYQHDVAPSLLKKSLHEVVESCVNKVGVNINTASVNLLQYISGIGPAIAKNIIDYRTENGLFKERRDLLSVSSFSSKVFEQAAGFLRVPTSVVLLDKTGIHPEMYSVVRDMGLELKMSLSQLMEKKGEPLKEKSKKWIELVGEYTFLGILNELEKPGVDPRQRFEIFKFREDLQELKDLQKGMICPGIITNVTNFGAFVDVGVHQDGLVHLSEISHEFISDPKLVVSPGDRVKVKVLNIDVEKKQISFSMLLVDKPKPNLKKVKSKKLSVDTALRKKSSKNFKKDLNSKEGARKKKRSPRKPDSNKKTRQPFNNPFAILKG